MKRLLILLVMSAPALTAVGQDMDRFHGCPMKGNAVRSDAVRLDQQKNRYDLPREGTHYHEIDIRDALRRGDDRGRFNEGLPAQIVGFVKLVKPGEAETCNCSEGHDRDFMDTHIELVPTVRERNNPRRVIVVEVSPRLRKLLNERDGGGWTTEELKSRLEGKWIRARGWLLYDHQHRSRSEVVNPGNRTNFKGGNWEIHPITDVEVLPGPPQPGGDINTLSAEPSGTNRTGLFSSKSPGELQPIFPAKKAARRHKRVAPKGRRGR